MLDWSQELVSQLNQGYALLGLCDSLCMSQKKIAQIIKENEKNQSMQTFLINTFYFVNNHMFVVYKIEGHLYKLDSYLIEAKSHLILIYMFVLRQLQRLSLSRQAAPFLLAFFSAKTKLSDAGEQAMWAHRIIELIKDPIVPTQLSQPSILEQIEAMDAPEGCKFQLKNQENKYLNKTEVMKMMTEGIMLNTNVFKQKNIQSAEQTNKQEQEQEEQKEVQYEQEQKEEEIEQPKRQTNNPFIFHPSYIGTSYIFNILDNPDQKPFILTGKPGIGKTISIIFYIHLNNFITKYVVQCSKDPLLQKQLELLQKENLLNRKFLKYWYWSVDYNDASFCGLSIERLIIEQIVELDQKQKKLRNYYEDFSDFRLQLAQIYPKSIQKRVIVDQVNKIANRMRVSNTYQDNRGIAVITINKKSQRKQDDPDFRMFFHTAFGLRRILRKFITLGTTFGLSSSELIERQLLKNELEAGNSQAAWKKPTRIAFNLDQSLEHFRIPYETMAVQPQGRIDFWKIGWFEIWRRLKTTNVDPKIIEEIKKIYMYIFRKNKVSSYFTFMRLRHYIYCNYLYIFQSQASNSQYFIPVLKKIFDTFPEYCLYQQDENSKYTRHRSLLYILQDLLFSKISNESQRNKLATFDLCLFKGFKFQNDTSISQKIQYIYEDRTLEIIPFQNENENNLAFYWTYQELYQVITHFLFPNIDFQFFARYSPLLNLHVKQSGGARGAALEKTIKQNLTSKTYACFHYPVALQDSSEVRQEKIKIYDVLIYAPNNLQTFLKDVEILLQSFKIMKNCNFTTKPRYVEDGVKNYNVPSIGIDFIIAEYEQDKKRLLVRTYKITALGDCSQAIKRFKESGFPQLTKMAQAGGYGPKSIKFEHIVLSLRNTIDFEVYKEPTLPHQVTIFFSDLTKLKFLGFPDKKEKDNLCNFQRYCQVVEQFRNHAASAKTN